MLPVFIYGSGWFSASLVLSPISTWVPHVVVTLNRGFFFFCYFIKLFCYCYELCYKYLSFTMV